MGQFLSTSGAPAGPSNTTGSIESSFEAGNSSGGDLMETPEKSADLETTPNEDHKLLQKRMKSLVLDPRSPSGIPRTPILVEAAGGSSSSDTPDSSAVVPVKRGQGVKHGMPISKLAFSPEKEEHCKENINKEDSEGKVALVEFDDQTTKERSVKSRVPMESIHANVGATSVNQTVVI